MWVVVRGRVGEHYFGVLDNNPSSIQENDEFWSGIEVPFEPRHVIDINAGNKASRALAAKRPTRAWPRH
jgi:hypothetical protein